MGFDPNDTEAKAAIKAAVESAVAEATEGLKAKNVELLAKLKKATKDSQVDPAEHAALQSELEATQAKLAEAVKAAKAANAETTMDQFLKMHDTEWQDKMLGKGKAQLWRDGKITLSQPVDGTGRELTLEELKALAAK